MTIPFSSKESMVDRVFGLEVSNGLSGPFWHVVRHAKRLVGLT